MKNKLDGAKTQAVTLLNKLGVKYHFGNFCVANKYWAAWLNISFEYNGAWHHYQHRTVAWHYSRTTAEHFVAQQFLRCMMLRR